VQELFGRKDLKATHVHRHVLNRGERESDVEKALKV
jgi:hypothetical protein